MYEEIWGAGAWFTLLYQGYGEDSSSPRVQACRPSILDVQRQRLAQERVDASLTRAARTVGCLSYQSVEDGVTSYLATAESTLRSNGLVLFLHRKLVLGLCQNLSSLFTRQLQTSWLTCG